MVAHPEKRVGTRRRKRLRHELPQPEQPADSFANRRYRGMGWRADAKKLAQIDEAAASIGVTRTYFVTIAGLEQAVKLGTPGAQEALRKAREEEMERASPSRKRFAGEEHY